MQNAFQGSLFTSGYFITSITQSPEWRELGDQDLAALQASLRAIFERFPAKQSPNETQTENDLIWQVLEALGWTSFLVSKISAAGPRGRA